MILNLIVLAVIILLSLYLSTQGLLSAILAFIAATFASILAMALFEPLEFMVANYRPDYGHGVTFLILFFLAFSGVRIAADLAVPKNVALPIWIDRISGFVVGIFAAMVVIGTTIIGVEMLPLPTRILQYDRFPAKAEGDQSSTRDRMQVLHEEGGKLTDVIATVAPQKSVWLAPDRFVLGIWNLASGRSLGGATSFGARHPDLSVESYGYRNIVERGSAHAIHASLVHLVGAYRDKDPVDLQRFQLADSTSQTSYQALVIRTEIDQGSAAPLLSADEGGMFRITPTQIRLVTDKGHQYYPVGYLEKGNTFKHTSLANGVLVDDYPASLKVVHDWVFPIGEDEQPRLLEIKQLARFEAQDVPALANVDKASKLKSLAEAEYPPHTVLGNPATLKLTVEIIGADKRRTPLANADVFIVQNTVIKRGIESAFKGEYEKLVVIKNQWEKGEGGWGDQLAGKPGVPDKNAIQNWITRSINEISSKAPEERVNWATLIPVLLHSEMTPDGRRNLEGGNRYFDDTLLPLMKANNSLVKKGQTGADGKFDVTLIQGSYTYIVRYKSPEFMAVWCRDATAEPKKEIVAKCDTGSMDFAVDMRIMK